MHAVSAPQPEQETSASGSAASHRIANRALDDGGAHGSLTIVTSDDTVRGRHEWCDQWTASTSRALLIDHRRQARRQRLRRRQTTPARDCAVSPAL